MFAYNEMVIDLGRVIIKYIILFWHKRVTFQSIKIIVVLYSRILQ